jgi:hypothetical protein
MSGKQGSGKDGDSEKMPMSPLAQQARDQVREAGKHLEYERREKDRMREVGAAQGKQIVDTILHVHRCIRHVFSVGSCIFLVPANSLYKQHTAQTCVCLRIL